MSKPWYANLQNNLSHLACAIGGTRILEFLSFWWAISCLPFRCSSFRYFPSLDETLPFVLCSIQLSGVLAAANLHLPCSFHPNYFPKSGTTSCDLFSLKACLLHLPLLCVAIWWIDIDLPTGAQWPRVLGSFVLFAYCLTWHSFLSNAFCFLRDCCEYKKQSPSSSSHQSLCSSFTKYLGMCISGARDLFVILPCHQSLVCISL